MGEQILKFCPDVAPGDFPHVIEKRRWQRCAQHREERRLWTRNQRTRAWRHKAEVLAAKKARKPLPKKFKEQPYVPGPLVGMARLVAEKAHREALRTQAQLYIARDEALREQLVLLARYLGGLDARLTRLHKTTRDQSDEDRDTVHVSVLDVRMFRRTVIQVLKDLGGTQGQVADARTRRSAPHERPLKPV